MKITVIYGAMHKGSTYNCVRIFLEQLEKEINITTTEFFLPKDMPHFCTGCFSCFANGEETCPHYSSVHPIASALEDADLIILASPVYVYDVSGQMKTLLDHFGYRWMVHRPHPDMFNKIGVVFSTTAGGGNKRTNETMKKSLFYWGAKRVFSYGKAVQAASWDGVSAKKKKKITAEISAIAQKVADTARNIDKIQPSMSTKSAFKFTKLLVSRKDWNKKDRDYWQEQGWFDGKKPW